MNMKTASLSLLAMIALCGAQAHADVRGRKFSSDKNCPSDWQMSSAVDIGMVDYAATGLNTDITVVTDQGGLQKNTFTGPKLSLAQNIAFKSLLNLRLRTSGAFSLGGANELLFVPIPSNAYALNGDAYLFFPISINHSGSLKLLPLIGWGFHQNYGRSIEADLDDDLSGYFAYRSRAFAPLAGLYLQLKPTERFFLKGGFSLHFPTFKQKFLDPELESTSYQHLKARRQGMASELEMHYSLSSMTNLTGKWEYLSLAASGNNASSARIREVSYTLGVELSY